MAGTNGTAPGTSQYLIDYLPEIYRQDGFLPRFLAIFEDVLSPIERMLDSMPAYFDPATTPPHVLSWLATWLGIAVDERWPLHRRRMYVRKASELFQLRGTASGLELAIEALTGSTPQIIQPEVPELAANPALRFTFRVVVRSQPDEAIDQAALEALIEAEKPAFAAYSLEILAG